MRSLLTVAAPQKKGLYTPKKRAVQTPKICCPANINLLPCKYKFAALQIYICRAANFRQELQPFFTRSKASFILFILLISFLFACKDGSRSEAQQIEKPDTVRTLDGKFIRPAAPQQLKSPQEKLVYTMVHYWDFFDFADTCYVPTPDVTEQAFVDYVDLLRRAPADKAQTAVKDMITKCSKGCPALFSYFTGQAERYLYEGNSPLRNEELYIAVLEALIATPALTETEKTRPRFQLDLAKKNRTGTQAFDFSFVDIHGRQSTLYDQEATLLLVFFNEPDCPSCREHIKGILTSAPIQQLQAAGRLKVLGIYPDEDIKKWKDYFPQYPKEWTSGYNSNLISAGIYDLKAIPTLYLLDAGKRVLLKDATLETINRFLAQFVQQ